MRDFACPHCGQRLAFENSVCLSCSSPIGFDLTVREFAVLGPDGVTTLDPPRQMCANLTVAGLQLAGPGRWGAAVPVVLADQDPARWTATPRCPPSPRPRPPSAGWSWS